MARHDEIKLAAIRRASARAAERAQAGHSGIYTTYEQREVREPGKPRVASVGWLYTLRHNDAECEICGDWMQLAQHQVKKLVVEKIWWCSRCNFTLRGSYLTYVIQEFPGRD